MTWNSIVHRWALGLAICAGFGCYSTSAMAAEKVVLKYSIIQMTIPVSELDAFVTTGQLSPALETLLGKANKQPEQVRRVLTQPIKVDRLFLDRALNSPLGEMVLDEVAQVIHTPSGGADRQALRSALVLSASSDNQVTLLETIKNYPTPEVQVEGERLVEAYGQVATLAQQLSGVTEKLQDLLNKIQLPKL